MNRAAIARSFGLMKLPAGAVPAGPRPLTRVMAALLPGLRRNVLAVADQGLIALSNFALLLVLSRILSVDDFGAYSFALSIFFLAAALHSSLLIEPMLVFGATHYREVMAAYIARLVRIGNSGFVAVLFVGFLLTSFALRMAGQPAVSDAMFGIAFAAPFILLSLLLRRACYVRDAIHLSVIGGVLYFATLLLTVYLMSAAGLMSLRLAAIPMGIAGALAAGFLLRALPAGAASARVDLRDIARRHGRYARWSASSETIGWLVSNLPILLLPLWYGLSASATFKVLNLLYMPLYQAVPACMNSLVPILARARGTEKFSRLLRGSVLLWLALAALYGLVMTLCTGTIMQAVYGNRYQVSLPWLLLLAAGGGCFTLGYVLFAVLRAIERPDLVFKANLVLAAILIGGVPLYPHWGVTAVLASLAIGWGGVCVAAAFFVSRLPQQRPARTL